MFCNMNNNNLLNGPRSKAQLDPIFNEIFNFLGKDKLVKPKPLKGYQNPFFVHTLFLLSQKKCNKCFLDLPYDHFNASSFNKDGLQGTCRKCHHEYKNNRKCKGKVRNEYKVCMKCKVKKEYSLFSKRKDGTTKQFCRLCTYKTQNKRSNLDVLLRGVEEYENEKLITCG